SVLPLEDAFVPRLIGRGASAHCCPHCPAECCGAYAIGATAPPALSAIRRPLEPRRARDCSETTAGGGHAAQACGGPRGCCGGTPRPGASRSSSGGTIQTGVQCGRRAQTGAVSAAPNDVVWKTASSQPSSSQNLSIQVGPRALAQEMARLQTSRPPHATTKSPKDMSPPSYST